MTLIFQNDPALPLAFRQDGCSARSLMAMAEFTLGVALTLDQIQTIIKSALVFPSVLLPSMVTGTNEGKIIQLAFEQLSDRGGYGNQNGYLGPGGVALDWENQPIPAGGVQFTKLHWTTDYPAGHFTLGDATGKEIFDPWSTADGFNPFPTGEASYTINKHSVSAAYCYSVKS